MDVHIMEKGIKRKLAAILSADVAGYSRLMSEDEVSTVRTLQDYRSRTHEIFRVNKNLRYDSLRIFKEMTYTTLTIVDNI